MFTGIDEVDWATLRHAYGSAEDVPGLLRGLASADPAEREGALDGLYGAVHQQGDVYDSTLACVPFLFALAESEGVRDRGGIVELLVSIGWEGEDRARADQGRGGLEGEELASEGLASEGLELGNRASQGLEPENQASPGRVHGTDGTYAMARSVVRAGAEGFVRMIGDADASVRRAAAGALVRFLDEPARVLGLLRERITVERDDQVLLALTESLGLFVRRHPTHAAPALDLLVAQSASPYEAGLRLAALGQLAGCAPDRLPADLVPVAVRLLRERSALLPAGRDDAAGHGTHMLIGRMRRPRPSDEEGALLLRTLHAALDDRVDDRIALLRGQLTSPDPTDRCNGVWMSAGLLREWRADHAGTVTLIGAQLAAEEDRLHSAAVCVLVDLFELAAPAADQLAALVAFRPDLWVRRWNRVEPALGGPLKALARSGDPRAVPVLAEVLAGPKVPGDLGQVIGHLSPYAAPLAPAIRRRLGAIPLGSPETPARAVPLLSALVALRDREAVPEVMRLVRGTPAGLRPGDAHVGYVVRALGTFGPAARDAIPVLRGLLDTEYASVAARALWEVEGDASVVLPVLLRELAGEEPRRRRPAADALSRMGPAAGPASAALRRITRSGDVSERATAACAVWRIDGEAEPVLPALRAAWTQNPHTRGTVARCLAEMGRAAAPLRDLLETELRARRRHLAGHGGYRRYSGHDIPQDEQLLRTCREALRSG
ncbi:HEAT repeat domain-containing protein [Streptomyces sp. NPDC050619]|uniref:HEAT repeat domain-containing protein n=1 Tax=Streptomyces sp. NPDC050619 TaxID=3157214 RepID=UPI00342EA312